MNLFVLSYGEGKNILPVGIYAYQEENDGMLSSSRDICQLKWREFQELQAEKENQDAKKYIKCDILIYFYLSLNV